MKNYTYVGPDHILERVLAEFKGFEISISDDLLSWIVQSQQQLQQGILITTFVIDLEGRLLVADRHSEHVQCAFGSPVLSAGEITFEIEKKEIEVIDISNQSTGYCPHINSWPSVQQALDQIGWQHPNEFTNAFTFGYCDPCRKPSILKGLDSECSRCGGVIRIL